VIIRNSAFNRTGERGYNSVIVTSENPSEGRLSALLLARKPYQKLVTALVNPEFFLNADNYFHPRLTSAMIAVINPTRAARSNKATPTKKRVFATFSSLLKELHSLTNS
jgi:hypothetical protein